MRKEKRCKLTIIKIENNSYGWEVCINSFSGSTEEEWRGTEFVLHQIGERFGRTLWGLRGMQLLISLGSKSKTVIVKNLFVIGSKVKFFLEDTKGSGVYLIQVLSSFEQDDRSNLLGKTFILEDLNPLPNTVDEYSIPMAFYDKFDNMPKFHPRTESEIIEEIERTGNSNFYRKCLSLNKARQYFTEDEWNLYQIMLGPQDYIDRQSGKWNFRFLFNDYIYEISSSLLNFFSIKSGAQKARLYTNYLQSLAFLLRFESIYNKIETTSFLGPLTAADIYFFAFKELGLERSHFIQGRVNEILDTVDVWMVKYGLEDHNESSE